MFRICIEKHHQLKVSVSQVLVRGEIPIVVEVNTPGYDILRYLEIPGNCLGLHFSPSLSQEDQVDECLGPRGTRVGILQALCRDAGDVYCVVRNIGGSEISTPNVHTEFIVHLLIIDNP